MKLVCVEIGVSPEPRVFCHRAIYQLVHAWGTRQTLDVSYHRNIFIGMKFDSNSNKNHITRPVSGPFSSTMASSSEFNLSTLQLYADEAERLLICCHDECHYALSVTGSQVTSHLRDKHQIPQELRNGLTRHLKNEYPNFFRTPVELPPRDKGSQIHPQLRIYDRFVAGSVLI